MARPGFRIEITEDEILADLFYPAAAPGRTEEWARLVTARWADVDANGHMRNTAYSDLASDARFAFFAEHGFPLARLHGLGVTPVILAERLTYRREVMLGERLIVSVAVAALSGDSGRATMEQRIRKADGVTAATVQIDGGWLSLETRKLTGPPAELANVMRGAPRTEEFTVLES
jgi:acyl-CoA thioester hydrolase